MYEYITEAVVLERQPLGDKDSRVSFFTKRFGKLVGRATSARTITSKLSSHLEPGTILKTRIIEKRVLHIADALKSGRAQVGLSDLRFLNHFLGDGEPDMRIWRMLVHGPFAWKTVLSHLGWDASYAKCSLCGQNPESFSARSQEFFCTWCASKMPQEDVLYIYDGHNDYGAKTA